MNKKLNLKIKYKYIKINNINKMKEGKPQND